MFIPISSLVEGGLILRIHRVAAGFLIGVPLIYALLNYSAARKWLEEALFWTKQASKQPNRWKRYHKSIIVLGYTLFATTGLIAWFSKTAVSDDTFFFVVFLHDMLFISAALVLMYHVYFELDWWLWKRKHCQTCDTVCCAESCPSGSLVRRHDGIVDFSFSRCNNCRECMKVCQRNSYYLKTRELPPEEICTK